MQMAMSRRRGRAFIMTSKPAIFTIEVDADLATRVRAAADARGGATLPLAAVVAALLAEAVAGLDPSCEQSHSSPEK